MKGSGNHVRAGVAAAAIFIGTVAGTAIAASTSSPPPATTCGIPYTFRFDRTTLTAGSCAGLLPRLPAKISMRLGQRVSVEIAHETNGSLDYPVPSLEGSAVRLLGRQGPAAIFQARSLGTSELLSRHTRFCESSDPAFDTCPVLVV